LIVQNGILDVKEVTFLPLCYIPKTMVLKHGPVIHISLEPLNTLELVNSIPQKFYSKMDQYGTLLLKILNI
jgi:hypothetical protein